MNTWIKPECKELDITMTFGGGGVGNDEQQILERHFRNDINYAATVGKKRSDFTKYQGDFTTEFLSVLPS